MLLFALPMRSHTTLGHMWNRILNRPTRLQAVVVSLVSLISGFGASLSADQVALLTTFSAAVISLLLDTPRRG